MTELKKEELEQINGGFSVWAGLAIAASIVLAAGIIDGFVHPKACDAS